MTSFRQIEANRRNAQLSTGPVTDEGKRRSRQNAVRHGLTAETIIDALEDAEDYAAFEMAVTTDYDAQTAVERELVLRLASLLWRLRRATAIESGLFKIQARQLLQFRQQRQANHERRKIIDIKRFLVTQDNHALDNVEQFPHISGPAILLKGVNEVRTYRGDRASILCVDAIHESPDQERNVVKSLAKRR